MFDVNQSFGKISAAIFKVDKWWNGFWRPYIERVGVKTLLKTKHSTQLDPKSEVIHFTKSVSKSHVSKKKTATNISVNITVGL